MVNVTREELYEEVWSKPMTKACKKYGISDVGLRKICKKHNIPTPLQGYWAKLLHGKPVRKIELPKSTGSDQDMIIIYGQQEHLKGQKSRKLDVHIPEELVPTAQTMKDRL